YLPREEESTHREKLFEGHSTDQLTVQPHRMLWHREDRPGYQAGGKDCEQALRAFSDQVFTKQPFPPPPRRRGRWGRWPNGRRETTGPPPSGDGGTAQAQNQDWVPWASMAADRRSRAWT